MPDAIMQSVRGTGHAISFALTLRPSGSAAKAQQILNFTFGQTGNAMKVELPIGDFSPEQRELWEHADMSLGW